MCSCCASVSNRKGIRVGSCLFGGQWWELCAGRTGETSEPNPQLPNQVCTQTYTGIFLDIHQSLNKKSKMLSVRFSGITAAMLRPITTTLRDVQVKLKTLLPSDAVLVGHSINNDLVALKVSYPWLFVFCLEQHNYLGQGWLKITTGSKWPVTPQNFKLFL